MKAKGIKIAELSLLVLGIALTIWFVNRVGIEQIRANVDQFGIWAPVIVLLLRLTSIVIPALPVLSFQPCRERPIPFWLEPCLAL